MENRIVLSGGLGNQIFQYVAGRAIFGESTVILDYSLLKPTLLKNQMPEISEFVLNKNVVWNCPRRFVLTRKIAELILKGSSIREDKSMRRRALIVLFPIIKLIFASLFFKGVHIATPRGIGASPVSIKSNRSNLLIGNFHSYIWFHSNSSAFKSELTLKNISNKLDSYKNLALKEKPLIIQLRFGDFLQIPELNVVTPIYFKNALASQAKLIPKLRIWIFSNDLKMARQVLSEALITDYREIDSEDFSSGEILELLKLGSNYIISNSTFGWWGASLSWSSPTSVCVPSNWYATMMAPSELLPATWHKIPTGNYIEN